jgi:hypothetical protein
MSRIRKLILGVLGGTGVCVLLALTLMTAGFSPASAATPPGSGGTPTVDEQAAFDAIFARFSARLGTDEATINAAFVGAVNDTADEAVRNGQLSADDAAQIKAAVASLGLKGIVASAEIDSNDGSSQPVNQKVDAALDAAWNAITTTLGIDARQLKQGLANGKSLAEIAQERGVDPAQLRAAMLAAARAELDRAVADKAISAADADVRFADLTRWADDLLSGKMVPVRRERVP